MMPGEVKNYESQWRAYGQRRILALFFLYLSAPVCVIAIVIAALQPQYVLFGLVTVPVWLGATWAAIWWAGEFRCPRCLRRFGAIGSRKSISTWSRGLFDKICHNCRVRKFAETE